jgi:hypothetical protein
MNRAQVRTLFASGFRWLKKTPLAKTTKERLEFIEAFKNSIPTFRGTELLGSRTHVLERLGKVGLGSPRHDSAGDFFDDFGFGLYSPGEVVEGVSVYRKGYYDR